jgi:hypothetical protein
VREKAVYITPEAGSLVTENPQAGAQVLLNQIKYYQTVVEI